MVLSLHERRVIADLERSLTREEPELSRTLADFGRAHPEPLRAPPVQAAPEDPAAAVRARRITSWSSGLALTLMCVALALSAAGLLLAASAAALAGVACWAVYRCRRHRQRTSRDDPAPRRRTAP
jgi:Flp pilus assembly protein TadB